MKPTALSIEGLREAVSRLPDNALTATRQAALAKLHQHGMPTARDEDWKYTDLGSAIDISNRWLSDGAAAVSTDTLAESIALLTASIDANWLVVANGLIDLSHFIETAGIEVEQFSNSAAPLVSDRPLADLNAALLNDGLRVQINAATEKPLGILIVDEANDGAAVSQVNVEIEVTAGCDAEIIEYHTSSGDDDHYGNSVVALQIGQAAATSYVRIQNRRIGHVQTGQVQGNSIALGSQSAPRLGCQTGVCPPCSCAAAFGGCPASREGCKTMGLRSFG